MLTIHTRQSSIDPAGPLAVRPVTMVDIALSEGLTRRMKVGEWRVPENEADAQKFKEDNATPVERGIAFISTGAERNLLIRLVIRKKLGSITGDVRPR